MPVSAGCLDVLMEANVETPMRDGVLLRSNLWRPRAPGKFPAILLRTPYGKSLLGFERYVHAGYAVICQDVRGRYASDGVFRSFHVPGDAEAQDGYDTIEWLAAQPWCDGNVGMLGTSYVAYTQWAAATLRPPHLRCLCAAAIPTDIRDVDWTGAFRPARRLHWWFVTIAPDLRRRAGLPPPHSPAQAREIWEQLECGSRLHALPIMPLLDQLPPPLAAEAKEWLRNPGRPVWHFAERHRDITVPNLDTTGWFDHCSSLNHFTGMQRNGGSETARTQTRMICGPWSHVTHGARNCHGTDLGIEAQVDLTDLRIRWFDCWLKGIDNGVRYEPPMRYYVFGSRRWKSAAAWPPPRAGECVLRLASAGNARGIAGDGSLTDQHAGSAEADRFRYDPTDPAPTLWDKSYFACASDRRRTQQRPDILIYRTAPLTQDVEIAGPAELILHASTSAPDTDWFAHLADESPDGAAPEVAYGMVRARHRNSVEREEFIKPGHIVEYRIRLTDTACRFLAGHRIRLEITSSNFPQFDRNHNTGRNDLTDAELRVADQTVWHNSASPSRLILPVVADGD